MNITPSLLSDPTRPARLARVRARGTSLLLAAWVCVLAACSTPVKDANRLAASGQQEEALAMLKRAQASDPEDADVQVAFTKQRELLVSQWASQAEAARAAGRFDVALQWVARIEAVAPNHPKATWLRDDVARAQRLQKLLAEGRQAFERKQYDNAEVALRNVLEQDQGNAMARAMLARIADARAEAARNRPLLAAADKQVTLEFRDAPLRSVFEALSRAAGVNFVFDKDVRPDQRVTLFLRDTTVDEAMRVILSTQQLDRKLLNENSVLIYPNNQQKQREHQELVTRSFYLVNADVKQAQTLVRTMAKTRDIYVDERLNLLVVRDSPEVVRLVERLMDSIDIAEPEVMMDVQVLEVSSNTMRDLGLQWPTELNVGIPPVSSDTSGSSVITKSLGSNTDIRLYIANPALLARFDGSNGDSKVLAKPRIRARNHEKAHIQIGNKLPVFTTTSTANVGTATSVTYLDVGIKLDVEPSVLLDDDVVIKVGLEVSNVVNQVQAKDGTTAYNVGTRQTTTSLRLRDGETQILAGLINDADHRSAAGIAGLSEIPFLGALFGVNNSTHDKSEVVLLITPHIVRNVSLPPSSSADVYAGTDTQPGLGSLKMRSKARVGGAATGRGGAAPQNFAPPPDDGGDAGGQGGGPGGDQGGGQGGAGPAKGEPTLGGPQEVVPGSGFTITVTNPGAEPYNGELSFDASVFMSVEAGPNAASIPLQLGPGASRSLTFTVKPQAGDASSTFSLSGASASHSVSVRKPGAAGMMPPTRSIPVR